MMRAPFHHTAGRARALFALAALACLLCSDGVGPRLVPYPSPPVGARQSSSTPRDAAPHAARGHEPSRERALIAQGVKLSSLKQDKAGGHTAPGVLAARAASALPPHAAAASRSAACATPADSLRHMVAAPHRGPPHLS